MQVDRHGKMLVAEITLTDPKFYVEPIKFTSNFRRAPDTAVLEYDCARRIRTESRRSMWPWAKRDRPVEPRTLLSRIKIQQRC